jgi:hypothetical protein
MIIRLCGEVENDEHCDFPLDTAGCSRRAMNKIEEYKKEKDGLDILADIPRYAAEGWESITDGDKERLKWAGVFFRRQLRATS